MEIDHAVYATRRNIATNEPEDSCYLYCVIDGLKFERGAISYIINQLNCSPREAMEYRRSLPKKYV